MIYLSHFSFPDIEEEYDFIFGLKRTCYDTVYPFQVLSKHGLRCLDFEPITILYGGNGSGKTTALNVMAETLKLDRDTLYNRSNFFTFVKSSLSDDMKKVTCNSFTSICLKFVIFKSFPYFK